MKGVEGGSQFLLSGGLAALLPESVTGPLIPIKTIRIAEFVLQMVANRRFQPGQVDCQTHIVQNAIN